MIIILIITILFWTLSIKYFINNYRDAKNKIKQDANKEAECATERRKAFEPIELHGNRNNKQERCYKDFIDTPLMEEFS